ncbi:MAG: histidine kinase [Paludibaculum sp.]
MCLIASPLMMGCFALVHRMLGSPLAWPPQPGFWFGGLPTGQTIFWCSVAGGYFLRTLFQLHEQEKRASRLALEKSELEASLNRSQLETLRARLNPHFLFNSLQNISVLAGKDPQTTSRMLMVLGDLLRAVLRRDSQPECTLREEIELTRSYVTLEQMRFADRLSVSFDIASKAEQAMIPCFLMQPLIENAIIHGLRGVRKTGIIVVRATPEGDQLAITVVDNGVGPPSDSAGMKIGVGLGSTCERLDRMYGTNHEFSIRKQEEGGTEVRIAIPLRFVRTIPESSVHDETPALNR